MQDDSSSSSQETEIKKRYSTDQIVKHGFNNYVKPGTKNVICEEWFKVLEYNFLFQLKFAMVLRMMMCTNVVHHPTNVISIKVIVIQTMIVVAT